MNADLNDNANPDNAAGENRPDNAAGEDRPDNHAGDNRPDNAAGENRPGSNPLASSDPVSVLAIDNCAAAASIALVTLSGETWDIQRVEMLPRTDADGNPLRSAATLAPALDRWVRESPEIIDRLSGVAVSHGPGSFTGLRVAVTTAKTLAYVWRLPVVGVDSTAAIAATVRVHRDDRDDPNPIAVIINAYRGQMYAARHEGDWTRWIDADSPAVINSNDADQWMREHAGLNLTAGESRVVTDCPQLLAAGSPDVDASKLNAMDFRTLPIAVGVAVLGASALRRGSGIDPLHLVPRYLKPSAAEEKRRD